MRTWLIAKTEEEKRRQEEEKRRQEELRLEQRRIELDMLRTSLDRGVPPAMVPVVFAGMSGGVLPQAALEWAQQYLIPPQGHQPQLPPAPGPISPDHLRRDSQTHGFVTYAGSAGVPSTPGSAPQSGGYVQYQGPGSPTRARAHTMSVAGAVGRPIGPPLPRLTTGELITGPPAGQSHGQTHGQQLSTSQSENQSPSIFFHHWQPPTSQGASTQPATPSVDSPRKRKATGPQQAAPPPNTQASRRSPPFGYSAGSSTLSNPPPGRRHGHSRQRSDYSSYRPTGRGRGDSYGPSRPHTPGLGTPVEGVPLESSVQARTNTHTVSSMLSEHPSPQYGGESRSQKQQQHDYPGDSERRHSPNSTDEKTRAGGAAPPAGRTRDDE